MIFEIASCFEVAWKARSFKIAVGLAHLNVPIPAISIIALNSTAITQYRIVVVPVFY